MVGGTYGMGGLPGGVSFSHSTFFRPSGGDLRLELMAHCQSGVSKIRRLNEPWEEFVGSCEEDPFETSPSAKF